jgi:ribosomal protein S18 acetylase RimI-like enzyme
MGYTDTLIEVQSSKLLSQEVLDQVRTLERTCLEHDGTSLKLELDYKESLAREREGGDEGNLSKVENEFLYKINDQVVAYAGICGFDGATLEVNGMVHPDYRRQGMFTKLMGLVLKSFENRKEKTLLCLCDHDSKSGQGFLNTLDVVYNFSEYEMYLDKDAGISGQDYGLTFRAATNKDQLLVAEQDALYANKGVDEIDMPLPETEASRGMVIYLAYLNDQVIGKVNIQEINGEAGIYGLGVLPEYRGRGYGRGILNFAVAKAKDHGIDQVMLQVEAENSRALSLYTSCGFKVVSKMDYYEVMAWK